MIAVYVNDQDEAAALTEKGVVKIYTHSEADWTPLRVIPYDLNAGAGLAQVRNNIHTLVEKLEGCRVFVAKEIAGQLYYILEASGYELFEAEGNPCEFLDSVNEAIKTKLQEKIEIQATERKLMPENYFIEIESKRDYSLNLKAILSENHALTSKKILLPFLRTGDFKKLEILCDHPPGWIEREAKVLNYGIETEKVKENEYILTMIKG